MASQVISDGRSRDSVYKRRRLKGACDICRKKKSDSSEMPGNKCSNCNTFKTQCTHFYTSKDSSSVLNYKNSREHVAAILSQTTAYVPSTDPTVLYQILVDVAKYARNLEELLAVSPSPSTDLPPQSLFKPEDTRQTNDIRIPAVSEPDIGDDGVFVDSSIVDPLGRLSLRAPSSGTDKNYSFLGKSSSLAFLKKALAHVDDPDSRYKFDSQRQEFWIIQPWEQPVPETVPPQSFPDDDLLATLIDIYFKKINPMIALLHSPSFRASVADGEHLRDHHFGAVVLAACALAARFSDDPRVLMAENASQQSAGWRYFLQARPRQFGTSPKNVPFRSLYKLQVICLSVLFLGPSSTPRECWILSGFGIRLAQEMGAHLRSRYATSSRYEAELLRRAFWILISADTILSSIFGRPSVTTTEDYDVDLPAECDDEYWDEPYCFQQPANKPALTAYLISYLKLIGIFNRVQRAIYPVTRHKEFEPEVVAELDSALNEWVGHIPSHLRWDQNLEGIFLDQSTSLYVMYYHIQMLIHRPFILAPWTTSLGPSAFPSLSICANSARSCGHVMDVQSKRGGDAVQLPHAIGAMFDSAVILLLNVWGGRRTRLSPSDVSRAKADIKKCMDVLHLYEKRWPIAGRKCDMITEMLNRSSGSNLNAHYLPPNPSLKRARESDGYDMDSDVDASVPLPTAKAAQQLAELEVSIQKTKHLFSLPLSTEELGLFPVYDSFDSQYNYYLQPQTPYPPASSWDSGLDFVEPGNGYDESQQYESAPAGIWEDWSKYGEYPVDDGIFNSAHQRG